MGEEAEANASTFSSYESQIQVWKAMYGHLDTTLLCCAIDLGIADILHAHNNPLSLPAIAAHISPSPPTDLSPLHRIMRFLTRKGFFSKNTSPDTGDSLYSLTPLSKWLIKSAKPSLAAMVALQTTNFTNCPGSFLSECVRRGANPYELAHGKGFWSSLSADPTLNDAFNAAMACSSEIALEAAMEAYKDGFAGMESITDVGGGTGGVLGELVRRFPNTRGVNFDLPHVVASAAESPGVTHVAGDMFSDDVPPADAIFMRWILHCFQDEDCVKILSNCRKAIPAKNGKLIILDIVISDDEGIMEDSRVAMDIVMLTKTGGRERTEEEWKKLLKMAGFPRYNIIRIPALSSIIEAFPE